MSTRLLVHPNAAERKNAVRRWLLDLGPGASALALTASADSGRDLLRAIAREQGAVFGLSRASLPQLARSLASQAGLAQTPITAIAFEAVVARALFTLEPTGVLAPFGDARRGPGFPRAAAQALTELRWAEIPPERMGTRRPALAALAVEVGRELERGNWIDRPGLVRLAATAAARTETAHPGLDLPLAVLDLPVRFPAERDLLAALVRRAPAAILAVPTGDAPARRAMEAMAEPTVAPSQAAGSTALSRLQHRLFNEDASEGFDLDDSVTVFSAPGESREAVEIARMILARAKEGVPFDRMAILLRSPSEYTAHLEEALARAHVPAHMARGALRPLASGRAFLALLACAGEGLSARRFAEYLSLGQVPSADPQNPEAPARSPRRWEALLVDAVVIGGRDRWERRLTALEAEIQQQKKALDDPDSPRAAGLDRRLEDLAALRAYALPLLDSLQGLPAEAPWNAWLAALGDLARQALRYPDRVVAALDELLPLGNLGPVTLREVRQVLGPRLLETRRAPDAVRYGKVFVGPVDAARGLAFDTVFVPGLAERMFPRAIAEEPFLLDDLRAQLSAGLPRNADRVALERFLLHLAVGAAEQKLVLSYPRLNLELARPRVPSFYALEAVRAATGVLPNFDELAAQAETAVTARIGWPAPPDPDAAIDEAEHDLSVLARLRAAGPEASAGRAAYLLEANPHLGRALRLRPRKLLGRWTYADGLVDPEPLAHAALERHQLANRAFSPTALQTFSQCPYKFFLYTVHRLQPRVEPEPVEEMDPLTRGSLVHSVQFRLLSQLAGENALPVRPPSLDAAYQRLDAVLREVADEVKDAIYPAIESVWQDGLNGIRADLREWLERASTDASGWVPWRFELSFGLPLAGEHDPHSVEEPVRLDSGLAVRGSIDLVERRADGNLRATDYKTGKQRFGKDQVIAGGETLQPVLYALVLANLFPDVRVAGGRLYYCTNAGGFAEREVPLDTLAAESAEVLAQTVGQFLEERFLPAAPSPGACTWCDYRVVCGDNEEQRVARKLKKSKVREQLKPLTDLRERE